MLKMRSELTRPRLVIHRNAYADIDDYLWALKGWELSASQLSSGQFCCEDLLLLTEGFQYRFFHTGLKTLYIGFNESTGPQYCIPLSDHNGLYYLDHQIRHPSICCIPSSRPVKVITPDNFYAVTISFSQDYYRHLCETQGFLPESRLDGARFSFPDSSQMATLKHILNHLYERFSSVEQQGDELEDWLFHFTESRVIPQLSNIVNSRTCPQEVDPCPDKFVRAMHLILENLDSPPSILDLSSELGTTQRTLQYLFKEHAGIPPKQLIGLLRLNTARSLLKRTDLSRGTISDIANVLGYWHMGRFAQEFKRLFGKNPSDLWAAPPLDPESD